MESFKRENILNQYNNEKRTNSFERPLYFLIMRKNTSYHIKIGSKLLLH